MPFGCSRRKAKDIVNGAAYVIPTAVITAAFVATKSSNPSHGHVGLTSEVRDFVTGEPVNVTTGWDTVNGTMVPTDWAMMYPESSVSNGSVLVPSDDGTFVDPASVGVTVDDAPHTFGGGFGYTILGAMLGATVKVLGHYAVDKIADGYDVCCKSIAAKYGKQVVPAQQAAAVLPAGPDHTKGPMSGGGRAV
jgi:hypothetical protein